MNQFYVSIIFLGILLIVISLVWIVYDKKQSHDYSKQLDTKRDELVKVITDSEVMLEELNKFSDYIVSQMDLKNEEVCESLKKIDEKIAQVNETAIARERTKTFHMEKAYPAEKALPMDRVVNGNVVDLRTKHEMPLFNYPNDLIVDNIEFEGGGYSQVQKNSVKGKEKVIPLNSRHKEVIQLAEKGLSDTEIAKRLSMGKGEIQLILGINR